MNRRHPRRRREAGFSLIEALAAGALVLVMMLFILPLFTRAAIQNVSGRESSIASSHGKWTLEELNQLPLDRKILTLPTGDTTLEACAEWDSDEDRWTTYDCTSGSPAAGTLWRRQTDYRQFSVQDLEGRQLTNPLPGGTDFEFVHLRQLAVDVRGERNNPLGPARRIDFVTVRGF